MKKKKIVNILLLVVIVSMISIGYSLLSSSLKINGVSSITKSTWDIHFENAQSTSNSTVTPTVAPNAPAESKLQTISYEVSFDTPGQIYEFTVDVKNGGTIDAMIQSYISKIKIDDEETTISADNSNLPEYLNYNVTYADGTEIVKNHILASNNLETIKVHIEFKKDITNEQLEDASNREIELNIGIIYVQADSSVPAIGTYAVTRESMSVGSTIPNGVNMRKNASNAIFDWLELANSTKPFYLKFELNESNVITEEYVCYVRNNKDYCIKGYYGNDPSSPYLSDNAKIIYDAFKGENCYSDGDLVGTTYDSNYIPNPTYRFYCDDDEYTFHADYHGQVDIGDPSHYCLVDGMGNSYCNERS